MLPETAELYLDSGRGIYIPQDFAECTNRECVSDVTDEDWQTLLNGPDDEWYWEAWDKVESNAIITDPVTQKQFTLYQDSDLWIVPVDAVWPEDYVWTDEDYVCTDED